MNIAIVDDESVYQEQLKDILNQELPRIGLRDYLIFIFGSAEEFLNSWKPGTFQLIFLDIYMTGINGVELARKIREKDEEAVLIFSTSSNEFAAESYELNAGYYLQKTYDAEAVAVMLKRMNSLRDLTRNQIRFPDEYCCIQSMIAYTIYSRHCVTLTMADGEVHTVRMSQTEVGEILLGDKDFCQINQGIIVNFAQVARLDKISAEMKNGEVLPISRSNQKRVALEYADYSLRQMRKQVLQ